MQQLGGPPQMPALYAPVRAAVLQRGPDLAHGSGAQCFRSARSTRSPEPLRKGFGKRPLASLAAASVEAPASVIPEPVEALPIVGSPIAQGLVDNKPTPCVLDLGAVVTIVKRGYTSGPPARVSTLRYRNADGIINSLYGPVLRTLELPGGYKYSFPVYEADIADPCIIGTDFIHAYRGHVNSETCEFTLDAPRDHRGPERRVVWQFKFCHSINVGTFGISSIFALVRTTQSFELQPFSSANCTARLSAPASNVERGSLARVLRTECVLDEDGTLTAGTENGGRPVPMLWEQESKLCVDSGRCAG